MDSLTSEENHTKADTTTADSINFYDHNNPGDDHQQEFHFNNVPNAGSSNSSPTYQKNVRFNVTSEAAIAAHDYRYVIDLVQGGASDFLQHAIK